MKALRILAITMAFAGLAACGSKPAVPTFTGKIKDATMNAVTVKDAEGKIVTFNTQDADKSESYGMLIGNTATVEYTGDLRKTTVATKVSTDPTYAKAIGRWMERAPYDPNNVKGILIETEGVAKPINQSELRFTAWEVGSEENRLVLRGTFGGDDFEQTVTVVETDGEKSFEFMGQTWVK